MEVAVWDIAGGVETLPGSDVGLPISTGVQAGMISSVMITTWENFFITLSLCQKSLNIIAQQ